MPLPNLRHVDVGHRSDVLKHLPKVMEVDHVILAKECGRLSQQAPAPDDLLLQEQPHRVVRTIFHP
jgi:hypothetical protein